MIGSVSRHTKGFTIVELLIVVVVIAILAAVTIVSYTGVQNRAHDSAVQNDLRQFTKLVEMYNTQRGAYPQSAADLQWMHENIGKVAVTRNSYAMLFANSDGTERNFQYCYTTTTNAIQFAVVARSKSGNVFSYGGNASGEYTGSITGNWQSNCTSLGVAMTSNQTVFLYANTWLSWL